MPERLLELVSKDPEPRGDVFQSEEIVLQTSSDEHEEQVLLRRGSRKKSVTLTAQANGERLMRRNRGQGGVEFLAIYASPNIRSYSSSSTFVAVVVAAPLRVLGNSAFAKQSHEISSVQ